MSSWVLTKYTIPIAAGVVTGIKYSDLELTTVGDEYFVRDFKLLSVAVKVPIGDTVSITVTGMGISYGDGPLTNNGTGIQPKYVQPNIPAFSSSDGKAFTNVDGASVNYTKGFFGGETGFTVVVAGTAGPYELDVVVIAGGDGDSLIDDGGPYPDADPSDLILTETPNPDDPTKKDIQVQWTDNSSDELGFRIDRDDGLGNHIIRAVTAGVGQFKDNQINLVTGIDYNYNVKGFKYYGLSGGVGGHIPSTAGGGGGSGGGTVTTWVGSAPVAPQRSYPIWFTGEPSGIYTLEKDKDDDTLYDRSGAAATTDVKIPDPFFQTGYLGG